MWSILCHGGAGAISDDLSESHQQGCRRAAQVGAEILEFGGRAIDAACAAVRVLEDDPVFNAGIGATLDEEGMVTCDAAVCRGEDLGYGGVGAVAGVRHPVDLARAVMEDGKHALLVGRGAIKFARRNGIELWDPKKMETDPSRSKWWFTKADLDDTSVRGSVGSSDTVGAVARDVHGNVAAATSTGGLLNKYAGRVGDSPIAGAGTYARNDWGALGATGHGETLMRTVFAHAALIALLGRGERAPEEVLRECLDDATARIGGRGGAIGVLPDGTTFWARNTEHMGVAWVSAGLPIASTF